MPCRNVTNDLHFTVTVDISTEFYPNPTKSVNNKLLYFALYGKGARHCTNVRGTQICSTVLRGELRKLNSVALVRERSIPTERPPPVGEVSANFCG